MSVSTLSQQEIDKLKKAAARGAEYLDTRNQDWFFLIDEDLLDLRDGKRCVLGQLYGSFAESICELDMSLYQATHYGFYISIVCAPTREVWHASYDALTNAWREEISTRQAQVFIHL